MKFSSFKELQEFINEKENKEKIQLTICDARTIESARKRVKRFLNNELVYYQIQLRCIHGGLYKSKSKGLRRSKSRKLECPFVMNFRVSSDGNTLDLISSIDEHNHDPIKTGADSKMIPRKKRTMPKIIYKTGGGNTTRSDSHVLLTQDDAVEEDSSCEVLEYFEEPGSSSRGDDQPINHENLLVLIGKTATGGIKRIKDLGLESYTVSSDLDPDEPLPKRPNLTEDAKTTSKNVEEKVASRKQLAAEWLQNSKKKIEGTEKIADALNNIATQLGRIAYCFEVYNAQTME